MSDNSATLLEAVKCYFTVGEWNILSEYDKNRFAKILDNYNFLLEIGVNPEEPEFIKKKRINNEALNKRKYNTPKECGKKGDEVIYKKPHDKKESSISEPQKEKSDSNFTDAWNNLFSDEERAEAMRRYSAFNEIFSALIELLSHHEDKRIRDFIATKIEIIESIEKRANPKVTEITEESKTEEDKSITLRRYPKRNIPFVNYKEPDDIKFDDFFFCNFCEREWYGMCTEHPLKYIKDTEVKKRDSTFAINTLPKNIAVCLSKIPNSGHGVWTKEFLPAGVMFGPYEGKKAIRPKDTTYCWQVKLDDKRLCIDGSNTAQSNWMRYVNCARYANEQNLTAFQYKQNIFYKSIKNIPPYSELLVFYGFDYANNIGINKQTFYNSDIKLFKDLTFPCGNCKINFSSPLYLLKHSKYCRRKFKQILSTRDVPTLDSGEGKETEHAQCGDKTDHCDTISSNEHFEGHKGTALQVNISDIVHEVNNSMEGAVEINSHRNLSKCNQCNYSSTQTGNLKNHMRTHTGDQPYKCNECDYSCTQSGDLKNHMRTHTGGKPYKCNECDYSCTTSGDLKNHMRTHTGDKPYKCNECDYSCTQSGDLKNHMRTHTGDQPYKCNECDYSCTQSGDLKNHMRTHTGDKPYKCNECDYSCTQSGALKYHMRTHTGGKPYKCNECDYSCTQSGDLKNHMRTHTGDKPYKCNECDYRCTTSGALKYHMRTHTGDKPYKCNECDYRCTTSGALKYHMRTHTGDKPYKCNECDYSCTTSGNLKNHMRTHTGDKPYKCNECDYRCTTSGHLKNHMRTHTGDKPYKCNECDYRCTTSGALKYHMRTHTGDKPYKCNACDYSCIQSGDLKNHMRTHTGDKPYKCNECDYRCTTSGALKYHMRTHTGDKPYKCNECDYRCTTSGALKYHMRTHTGDKPYKCNECDYRCTTSGALKYHMRTHTGDKPYKCNECDYSCTQSGHLKNHVLTHTGDQPYNCNECHYSSTTTGDLE